MGEKVSTIIRLFGICLLASLVLAPSATAGYADARSLSDTHATVIRIASRLREARHVEDATEHYTELYGGAVGRWVWLAREVGWRWTDIPTLMAIIKRESNGQPTATNPYSGAAGLLQFIPSWWSEGQFNPYSPRQCLRRGLLAYRELGWHPWQM